MQTTDKPALNNIAHCIIREWEEGGGGGGGIVLFNSPVNGKCQAT